MPLDLSDPSLRDVYPLGVVTDVYVHFDIDPTLVQNSMVGGEQEIVDYLLSLTDVWNRDTYNPANFNLVVSSFSVNVKNTENDVMLLMQQGKVLQEGEQHMWVHVTDYRASSIGARFGLYTGEDNSYAIVTHFNGHGFTHGERSAGAQAIGHLFGLDHTHVLSLSYPDEVSVDIDYCGGGPNGNDCSTKPAIGGNVMSQCQECPGLAEGGGFYSAKPLTSFHPFQAEKIQEHYHDREERLAKISWPKLRTFIPSAASGEECASEGESCQCNGVVYFGPTITASSPRIFAVTQSDSRVDCTAGASEAFPDVFHRRSKSCYCDEGATLTDVDYLPSTVEFTNMGTGTCEFTCPLSRSCSWQSVGYMTLSDQPEWKCKQECLDRDRCHGYNWKDNECRLYQRPLTGASNSGQFMGSTCWSRPQGDGKYPDAQYTIQGESNDPIDPVVDECQYVPVDASECLDFDVFRYVCGGEEEDTSYWGPWEQWSDCSVDCGSGIQTRSRECIGGECDGDSSETQQCTLEPCDDDTATDSEFEVLAGQGVCRSISGAVVAGWGGFPIFADECKRMCEIRSSCIGYTAVTTGRAGTCYIHGQFTENIPSGWWDANGKVLQIGRASGNHGLACYRRV